MSRKASILLGAVAAAAFAVLPASGAQKDDVTPAPSKDGTEKKSDAKMTRTSSGLQYTDTVVGTGASPKNGQVCSMHYTGWLWENGGKGKKFDSSVDRGTPLDFVLGQGRVIKGWEEGIASMRVGGKRTLLVPPQLGYGASGYRGLIPPNATLLFELELVAIR